MLRKFRIRLNEKEYIVEMEELTEGAGFDIPVQAAPQQSAPVQQKAPAAPVQAAPEKETQAQASGAGTPVLAPMPGTVVGMKKKVGDNVNKGEVVVVFEAMKMENEIVSPQSGKITSMPITAGQAIDVDEVLFTVE